MNNIQKRINKILNDNRKKLTKKAEKEYTKEGLLELIKKSDLPEAIEKNKKDFIRVLELAAESAAEDADYYDKDRLYYFLEDLVDDYFAEVLWDMLAEHDDSDEANDVFCEDENYEYIRNAIFGDTVEDRLDFLTEYFYNEVPEIQVYFN